MTSSPPIVPGVTLAPPRSYDASGSRWGERRREKMEHHLARRYAVIPYSRDLARLWALATVRARRVGREIQADAWVAATALLYRVPVVTHNAGDFAGVPGLTIITRKPVEDAAPGAHG